MGHLAGLLFVVLLCLHFHSPLSTLHSEHSAHSCVWICLDSSIARRTGKRDLKQESNHHRHLSVFGSKRTRSYSPNPHVLIKLSDISGTLWMYTQLHRTKFARVPSGLSFVRVFCVVVDLSLHANTEKNGVERNELLSHVCCVCRGSALSVMRLSLGLEAEPQQTCKPSISRTRHHRFIIS